MKFYTIDETLQMRLLDRRARVRVQVSFDFTGTGVFVTVPESDIAALTVTSLREKTGGTVTSGILELDNTMGTYCPRFFDTYRPDYTKYNGEKQVDGLGNLRPGLQVRISYSAGANLPFGKRFILYVDENGFQQTATGSSERIAKVGLVDLSKTLKDTDKNKDWTHDAVFVRSVICDKGDAAHSLVHQIASRAGLSPFDIDCTTVSEYLPFVKLNGTVWDELSELARCYNAHLETTIEKPLVFLNSSDPVQFTFDSTNVTHVRMYEKRELYRNTIRLKWTRYREFSPREVWRYSGIPVLYRSDLTPMYPFVFEGTKRDIEQGGYDAHYTVATDDGKTLPVAWAEELDSKETFDAALVTDGPALQVLNYDVSTFRDRAVILLGTLADTVLLVARIYGTAIAGEPNFCHYLSDTDEILQNGTYALNETTPYLSETLREEVPYYEWWADRMLAKLKRNRKGFFLKTNNGIFHARVGAAVRVSLHDGIETERAEIIEMELHYKAREAFVASFFLEEE